MTSFVNEFLSSRYEFKKKKNSGGKQIFSKLSVPLIEIYFQLIQFFSVLVLSIFSRNMGSNRR